MSGGGHHLVMGNVESMDNPGPWVPDRRAALTMPWDGQSLNVPCHPPSEAFRDRNQVVAYALTYAHACSAYPVLCHVCKRGCDLIWPGRAAD